MTTVTLTAASDVPTTFQLKTGSRTISPVDRKCVYTLSRTERLAHVFGELITATDGTDTLSVNYPDTTDNRAVSLLPPSGFRLESTAQSFAILPYIDDWIYRLRVFDGITNNDTVLFDSGLTNTNQFTAQIPGDGRQILVEWSVDKMDGNGLGVSTATYDAPGVEYSVLDVQAALNSIVVKNSQGVAVSEITPGESHTLEILLEDTEGDYAGNQDPRIVLMDVDVGSESFAGRIAGTNINRYAVTPPSSNPEVRLMTFTVGKYQDFELTDLRQVVYTISLDVKIPVTPPSGGDFTMTFAEIQAGIDADDPNYGDMFLDEHYLAAALWLNPGNSYAELGSGVVNLQSIPAWSGPTVTANSATDFVSKMNNSASGTRVDMGGQVFTLPMGTNFSRAGNRAYNGEIRTSGSGNRFIAINALDVSFHQVVFDMQNKNIANPILVNEDGFTFLACTGKNVRNTQNITLDFINMEAGNAHIASSHFENIYSSKTPARAVRWDGVTCPGSKLYNNTVDDLQAANYGSPTFIAEDGDAFLVQNTTWTSLTRFYGNRGVNQGKRLFKGQNGNYNAFFNYGEWATQASALNSSGRTRRCIIAHQVGANARVDFNVGVSRFTRSNEETFGFSMNSDPNVHMNNNIYYVFHDSFADPGFDYGYRVQCDRTNNPPPSSSSMRNNKILGNGSMRAAYQYRASGTSSIGSFQNHNLGVVGNGITLHEPQNNGVRVTS